jgi:crotonobetainyl-CoA:carnitine CoA-transferase CaiB-like acyl-CoA transferase
MGGEIDGPLSGVRIIEVGGWYTGPMAACILADQGADVIKIEGPGGDGYRQTGTSRAGMSSQWISANRNKRFVTLDLKQSQDLETLNELIARADVFIHNTRPGAMARLGLDGETLMARHPRLIHVAISAFGQTGPFAPEPGFDTLFQALSGLCYLQGPDGRPQTVNTLLVDKSISPIVAQAVCAALFKREKTGLGSKVECSMLDAFLWWMWPDGMANMTFIGDEGVRRAPPVSDADMLAQTKDGYIVVTPHMQKDWEAFCRIVDRVELLRREDLATARDRMGNMSEFFREIRSSLHGKTTADWCELFRKAEIPNAPVLRPEDVLDHPQVQWNETIEVVEDERLGPYRSPCGPIRIDGEAGRTRRSPQPPGTDTDAVLEDWGVGMQ